jgi:hypothetical protein
MSIDETLRQASNSLLMPSESEYPFKVVHWEGQELTDQRLLELTGHRADAPVEAVELDYFFRNVAQEKEWHDDVQKANVPKFQILISTLKNLSDIKVYRVGTIDIDVYIVGKAPDGNLVGLATKVVETP